MCIPTTTKILLGFYRYILLQKNNRLLSISQKLHSAYPVCTLFCPTLLTMHIPNYDINCYLNVQHFNVQSKRKYLFKKYFLKNQRLFSVKRGNIQHYPANETVENS
jgi:hypothetical protein